jgi:hypothetical protein
MAIALQRRQQPGLGQKSEDFRFPKGVYAAEDSGSAAF